jgi:hypothetical protein
MSLQDLRDVDSKQVRAPCRETCVLVYVSAGACFPIYSLPLNT